MKKLEEINSFALFIILFSLIALPIIALGRQEVWVWELIKISFYIGKASSMGFYYLICPIGIVVFGLIALIQGNYINSQNSIKTNIVKHCLTIFDVTFL